MKIVFSGSNGFIGSYLKQQFLKEGHRCIEIPRKFLYDNSCSTELLKLVEDADVVINLRGASIARRWTSSYMQTIYNSRIITTKNLVNALIEVHKKNITFISTSAVGIYQPLKHHTDDSTDYANTFLARVCQDWETAALQAQQHGIRTVIFRSGIVLGQNGGIVKKLKPFFQLGLGAALTPFDAPFPWVHIYDWYRATKFAINTKQLNGTCNLVAATTTHYLFAKNLAQALHRPLLFKIPSVFLYTFLGKNTSSALIFNPSVESNKMQSFGFTFHIQLINNIFMKM